MRLGLARKLVRFSLKTLSSATLATSFQIWLSRESREWIIRNAADSTTPTAIQSIPKPPRHSRSKLLYEQNNNRKYGTNNCGLVNKGKTCYVNVSLQCQILVQFLCSHKLTTTVCCSFCKTHVFAANI